MQILNAIPPVCTRQEVFLVSFRITMGKWYVTFVQNHLVESATEELKEDVILSYGKRYVRSFSESLSVRKNQSTSLALYYFKRKYVKLPLSPLSRDTKVISVEASVSMAQQEQSKVTPRTLFRPPFASELR